MNTYVSYFRDIAVRNKRILHNPANEGTAAQKGTCKFALFSEDDVATKSGTAVSEGAMLFLHQYDWSLSDNEAGDLRKIFAAGFMVTRATKIDDVDDQEAAYNECEEIVDEIFAQMRADSISPSFQSPLGIIDWNAVSISPIGGLWGQQRYGWWVEFTFQKKNRTIDKPATLSAAFLPR